MIQIRPILLLLGFVLCTLAAAMLLPAVLDFADGDVRWIAFMFSATVTAFFGGLFVIAGYDGRPIQLGVRDCFALTNLTWITVAAFSAIPFVSVGLEFTDAYFEAMSGLTTTGSTVLIKLDKLPRGILFWRALLQGLGGLGIIVTAIIILPFLRIGGMQLFQTESSDRSEKIAPRPFEIIVAIASIYVVLIVLCVLAYWLAGMTPFDAVSHALTTVSTGGFATHDASLGFFQSATIEWIAILFMILGALPFVVLYKAAVGQPAALWHDQQALGFVVFVVIASLVIAMWLSLGNNAPFATVLRMATFAVVSIITGTGYIAADYTTWGAFAVGAVFLLSFIGGCSGSTTGGIKIYRFQIVRILARSTVRHLISPNRVDTLNYNQRRMSPDVTSSIMAFIVAYFVTAGMFAIALTATGLDLITALTSSVQAIGNVGPGLGDLVGPAGTYAALPGTAKWLLAIEMLVGRLEIFTVLVLLSKDFWLP